MGDDKVGGNEVDPYMLAAVILRESSDEQFRIRVEYLTKRHFDVVIEYLKQYYIPQYTIWKLLGLTEEGLEEYLKRVITWLQARTSLVAIQNETEQVVGFMIGCLWEHGNWDRETNRNAKYEAKEVKNAFHLFNSFHKSVDIFLIHNTKSFYIIHAWVILNLKKYAFITYELFLSLIHYCEIVGAGAISAMATKESGKTFLEFIGFEVMSSAYYIQCFEDYNLSKIIIGNEYSGFLMSYLVNEEKAKKLYKSSFYIFTLPSVLKKKGKKTDDKYWEDLRIEALRSSFRKLEPKNVIV